MDCSFFGYLSEFGVHLDEFRLEIGKNDQTLPLVAIWILLANSREVINGIAEIWASGFEANG